MRHLLPWTAKPVVLVRPVFADYSTWEGRPGAVFLRGSSPSLALKRVAVGTAVRPRLLRPIFGKDWWWRAAWDGSISNVAGTWHPAPPVAFP